MAADVSSLVRVMNGGDTNDSGKSTAPITRDLLGGCCTLDSKELDLDLQVPSGWEKRLDLKSGKVYLQRSTNKSPISKFQDLNFPPTSKQTLNLFDDPSLDPSSSNYQSVCTLDKVKSALERAEKETPRSTSSSSVRDSDLDEEEKSTASIAAGCPSCLLYVLVSRGNPKCPRCNSNVPLPAEPAKKPRIDLNISI
ncbi:hypothetical protein PHJA_001419200 [Phtheirospermum japonicum]|uniref:GIR1-like zinc ribbon domain-containing protein n=1 Tax=Phtheirospermum japonicum TaxID=374723 RepID=A0A830C168_9LAMI|nr:hypothetical protein PHJA_001419200 [Phtheirospermum japonicum]